MFNHFRVQSLILCSLLYAIISGARASAENPTFRVAPLIHLTGDYAMQGNAIREGIELAAEEINNSGGINGEKLELLIEDTHFDKKLALSAAKQAIEIQGAVVAMVMTFTETESLAPLFEKKQVPLISLWDSSPQIEKLGRYTFGFGPWTPGSGETAATFATKSLKANAAVTVATVDDWSLHSVELFKDHFVAQGGEGGARTFAESNGQ